MTACMLTEGCLEPADQVVVTLTGWVLDCCRTCAIAACDHIYAQMQGDDDLARFMVEQSAASLTYRMSLADAYSEAASDTRATDGLAE